MAEEASVDAAEVKKISRRNVLKAAMAAGGAAALGFPNIVKAQGVTSMRWQSTWPQKDIFHEYANDFAKKVNDMTGGELKIEVLPAGAVVPAFGLLDAVSKGTLDGGHGVVAYHYGKQPALALWGSGPSYGMDANTLLSWHKYGGGKELLTKLYASIGTNVVSFLYGPMPTQPLGWFKKPIQKADDLKGLKFRTVGLSIDVFTGLGAAVNALPGGEIVPAMDRGFSTLRSSTMHPPTAYLAFPTCPKSACCRAIIRARAVRDYVQQDQVRRVAGEDTAVIATRLTPPRPTCRGRRSTVTRRITWRCNPRTRCRFYKTPASVLQKQLEIFDQVAAKKSGDNAMFKEIAESQQAFAPAGGEVGTRHLVDRRMAYNHYFAKAAAKPAAPAAKKG